jgi:hypothetical protein
MAPNSLGSRAPIEDEALTLARDPSPDINLAPKCLCLECTNAYSKAVKPSILFSESNKVCTSLHRESSTSHRRPVLKPLERRGQPLSRSRTSTTYASRWRSLDGPRPITQAQILGRQFRGLLNSGNILTSPLRLFERKVA